MGTKKKYVDTREEVEEILEIAKDCVSSLGDRCLLHELESRKKNRDFRKNYQFNYLKFENMIYNLKCEDFCYSSFNRNVNYPDDLLYIFALVLTLYTIDDEEKDVTVYLKFRILDDGDEKILLISLHENESDSIEYMFK